MTRIGDVFDDLDRPALVGYLVAGDPTPEDSVPYLRALAEVVDVLEVGIPFSDPIADGPVIQAASTRALDAGMRPPVAFDIAERIREVSDVPLVFMTYFNILHRRGVPAFLDDARDVGVDGVIVPDLPLEEADRLAPHAEDADVDAVFLASPASDERRLARLAETTRGFLYLVSTYGITGSDVDFARVRALVERAQGAVGEVPLCVGFGVRSADHARMLVDAGADGVVVGSVFVSRVADGADPKAVADVAREIGDGLRDG